MSLVWCVCISTTARHTSIMESYYSECYLLGSTCTKERHWTCLCNENIEKNGHAWKGTGRRLFRSLSVKSVFVSQFEANTVALFPRLSYMFAVCLLGRNVPGFTAYLIVFSIYFTLSVIIGIGKRELFLSTLSIRNRLLVLAYIIHVILLLINVVGGARQSRKRHFSRGWPWMGCENVLLLSRCSKSLSHHGISSRGYVFLSLRPLRICAGSPLLYHACKIEWKGDASGYCKCNVLLWIEPHKLYSVPLEFYNHAWSDDEKVALDQYCFPATCREFFFKFILNCNFPIESQQPFFSPIR